MTTINVPAGEVSTKSLIGRLARSIDELENGQRQSRKANALSRNVDSLVSVVRLQLDLQNSVVRNEPRAQMQDVILHV